MTISTYSKIMAHMVRAATSAAHIIRTDFEALQCSPLGITRENKIDKNNLPDFVTETDTKAEQAMQDALAKAFPDIAFVGEESGGDLNADRFFLIDPLDGTSNFTALRDYFSVCAAYVENGDVKAAVIVDPIRDDIVCAAKGEGVIVNGVSGSRLAKDDGALGTSQLECELPFSCAEDFNIVQKLLPHMSGLRKSGSTALDILNLVKGRDIVCISDGLEPHDIAACILIVQEAGGTITELSGTPGHFRSSNLLAASTKRHAEVLKILSL